MTGSTPEGPKQDENAQQRLERLMGSMHRARGAPLEPEWELAVRMDPEFMESYAAFSNSCWSPPFERALPEKYRRLIGLVLLAYRGYHWTLPLQIKRAMVVGATKQEILEALEAGVLFGGAPVLHLGLRAMAELEKSGEWDVSSQ